MSGNQLNPGDTSPAGSVADLRHRAQRLRDYSAVAPQALASQLVAEAVELEWMADRLAQMAMPER